ncbi:MAG: helix-turn-helix domain-containing protein [Oscillospiraceae bacterium]|nr:helix-turn-helix domain-containing protein [Oscillospiraceae bacterium]
MLGEKIRQARLEQGLSQRQLCGTEITRNMLSQIESGKARPSMQTLTYLAQTLGKPVSFFLEETVAQPEAPVLTEARALYEKKKYKDCLEMLDTAGEAPGQESRLLRILCTLALARQSIGQERLYYAKSLLEKLPNLTEDSIYYTPALERERLLLLFEAGGDAIPISDKLPQDDRELLLRSRAALERRDYAKCRQLLSALSEHTPQSLLYMGQALLGQKQYREAIACLEQAEEAFPLPCARALETCYRELEDFKMAYFYACKQK